MPPDILLVALCMGKPRNYLKYALLCTVGSVLGGMFCFYIGYQFWHIAKPVLEFYGLYEKIEVVGNLYRNYTAWAVGVAGFTPIPYSVFTVAGGYFRIDFTVFVVASFISRGMRYLIVAVLIGTFGEKIKTFIDKYFNTLTVVIVVFVIGIFFAVKFFLK